MTHVPETTNGEYASITLPPGYALVPLEPTVEAIVAWYRVKNGFHYRGGSAPTDTSDYAAYRALIRAAATGELP